MPPTLGSTFAATVGMVDRIHCCSTYVRSPSQPPFPASFTEPHSHMVGIADLAPEDQADLSGDLLDPGAARRAKAERATDAIRARFGPDAIVKGRALR